jgi:hypothetical protein
MRWYVYVVLGALVGLGILLFWNRGECRPGTAADYFPYRPGMVAVYEGKGNEYASFTIRFLYQEAGRLEWRLDNGGTVMAEVFQVGPDAVTRIYREGEAYDTDKRLTRPPNASDLVLKGPIRKGQTWTSGETQYTILATDETVEAAGQKLTCVVVVEAKMTHSTIRSYYHRQYGWVLNVFESEGTVVESRLKSLTGP